MKKIKKNSMPLTIFNINYVLGYAHYYLGITK